MQDEQGSHHPVPPSVLMHRTIVTPCSHGPSRTSLGPLGGALTPYQLLQVDPFSLRLSEIGTAGPRGKVTNDDTA